MLSRGYNLPHSIFVSLWKKLKTGKFLHEDRPPEKNEVYHDIANGKCSKIVNSVFDFKSFVTEIFYLKFAIFKVY